MRRLRSGWDAFWRWYQEHYRLNLTIAACLFGLQVVHLVWLFSDVIWARLTGDALWRLDTIYRYVVIVIDYTEIPALIGVSLVYVNELRRGFAWKPMVFLLFLNSQWLHLFWITDEFVVGAWAGGAVGLPGWLAWVAILIDYAEVPVIVDTVRKVFAARREGRLVDVLRGSLRD